MEDGTDKTSVLARVGWAIVGGSIVGLIVAVLFAVFPYNRIVVPYQAMSSVVRVASAHLQKNGYIVLYAFVEGGWQQVGESYLLRAGYHRNIVIPVSHDALTEQVDRPYIARIYADADGDSFFDPMKDRPVLRMNGKPPTRLFWMYFDKEPWRITLWEVRNDLPGFAGAFLMP